jgi:hypothetical protein
MITHIFHTFWKNISINEKSRISAQGAPLDRKMDVPINKVVEATASYLYTAAGSAF